MSKPNFSVQVVRLVRASSRRNDETTNGAEMRINGLKVLLYFRNDEKGERKGVFVGRCTINRIALCVLIYWFYDTLYVRWRYRTL